MKKVCRALFIITLSLIFASLTLTVCTAYSIGASDGEYKITITDEYNNTISIRASDVDFGINTGWLLDSIFDTDTRVKLVRTFKTYGMQIPYKVSYNKDKLSKIVDNFEIVTSSNRKEAINAYIDTSCESGGIKIVPEVTGTIIDEEKLISSIANTLDKLETNISISNIDGIYKQADIKTTDLEQQLNDINKLTNFTITYTHGNETMVMDQKYLAKYLVHDKDGKWSLSDNAVDNFVDELYNKFNTYKKGIRFTTTDGRTVEVPGGNWGWKLNKALTKDNLTALMKAGVDATGKIQWSQTAPLVGDKEFVNYVEIDMGKQHLYLYTNNKLVGDWDIVSGMANDPGRRTPEGVYILTYKTKNAVLRGPTWESPVKYWMPFNGGIGMHDASWQPSFGGNAYYYRGSHGCINMPLAGARAVYEAIDKTYAIICYY